MVIREAFYDALSLAFLAVLVLLPGWLGLVAAMTAAEAWPTLGIGLHALFGFGVALVVAGMEIACSVMLDGEPCTQ